jgi:hypothetical protein
MKNIFISNLKFLFSIIYTNQNKNLKYLIKIFRKPRGNVKKYFFCLDLSRGLAAIFVVIYHYKHFYITNKENYIYSHINWPFYDIVWILYHYGYWLYNIFGLYLALYLPTSTQRKKIIQKCFLQIDWPGYTLFILSLYWLWLPYKGYASLG